MTIWDVLETVSMLLETNGTAKPNGLLAVTCTTHPGMCKSVDDEHPRPVVQFAVTVSAAESSIGTTDCTYA
jgi:hypothetical protein